MSNPLIPLTLLSTLMATAAVAVPLNIQVYNPGEQAVFPVSSELVTGDKEALLVVPQVMNASQLTVDGEVIEVKALNTPYAYLWAPSVKTAFGGVGIYSGVHVWMADSQTRALRDQWVATLDQLLALQPARVIPGHYLGDLPPKGEAVAFTRDYVQRFERELATNPHSAALIHAMTQAYPALPVDDGLAIGAKVATGEMKW